jgi:hypothetical protein
LLGSGELEKLDVIGGLLLAEEELVDLFLAVPNVTVA